MYVYECGLIQSRGYFWWELENVGYCRNEGVQNWRWMIGSRVQKKKRHICYVWTDLLTNRLCAAEQDFTPKNYGRREIISNSRRKPLWPVRTATFSAKMAHSNCVHSFPYLSSLQTYYSSRHHRRNTRKLQFKCGVIPPGLLRITCSCKIH